MKKTFYYYWFATTSISLADVIYIMVVTTFIYQKTQSAFIAALFPLLKAISKLIAGFTTPLLTERFFYSKLLVSLQFIKACLLTIFLVGFSLITNHIASLLIFILIISFIEGWATPMVSSVVPKVVPKDDLVKANSTLSVTNQSVQLAGYSFTGLMVIKFGHIPILIVASILYWLATVCLYLAAVSFGTDDKLESSKSKWSLIREGWFHLWKNPTLRIITIMDVIEGMAGTIWVGAITLVYVTEALHKSEQWWGYINSSYYIGTIIGGFFTLFIAKKIQKNLIISMAIGSFLFSFFTFLYGINSIPYLSLLLCIAMGPAYQLRDVAQQTAFQTSVDSTILPKVYASRSIILSTITSCSIALVGFIADTFGIRSVYIFGSILIAISALLSYAIIGMQKKKGTTIDVSL